MTEPGAASVVPIALVMNGRTGYTVWAAPWVEDGEEWQAFLGSGSRVWLFEELADLEATLRSTLDNDLTDHPAWPMLQTLPANQLVPDVDYRFDLDVIPELTQAEADPEVVERVTESLDMVERIAECCDNGTLLHLLEQPGFADLLGFEEEGDADEDATAEAEDAEAGDTDAGDTAARDAEVTDAEGTAGADAGLAADAETAEESVGDDEAGTGAAGADGGSAEVADATEEEEDEEEEDEEEDEDYEDEDDDAWAEIGAAIRTAWPGVLKKLDECVAWRTTADLPEPADATDTADTADAAGEAATDDREGEAEAEGDADGEPDTEFWNSVGIMPVELMLPSGTGYTLRCYVDDEPRFLGADMTVDIFRSRDGLVSFCQHEDTHDLADLETWDEVRDAEDLDVTPPRADRYDLTSVDAQLIGGPTVADVRLVRGAVDVVQDLAEYCELAGVQAAFGADSPLGTTINELFATSVGSSMLPAYWSGEGGAAQWRTLLDEIDSCMRWHD